MRAGNRLNRDNAGRISGIGRNGATVRGGRLKTAKGNRRATQLALMKAAGFRSGTIAKGGRGISGPVARSLAAARAAGGRKAAGLSRARPGQEQRAMQRVGGAGTVLQRRDNAEAQRVAASGGRRTSRKAAINRRMYNSITTAIRARYAIDNPGKQRRYSTVKNPGPAGVSALTTKAPRLTAKASQPSPQTRAKRPASTVRKPSGLRPGALATTKPAAKKAARGPKVKLPRMATPTGVIRGSDRAKVKADARKGIGTPYSTPYSRASQRAFDRSAREAPLQRKQAIAAAKRKGRTGFGKGPQMNAGSIGSREFAWNKNETPATAQERLAMWRKGERRMRGFWSGGRGVAGAYAGALRASRRAAALVESGNRLGNLPTTRKMAEQPRQRRLDRVKQNETRGSLASSDADRRLLPQIQKVRDAAQKRIAEGKKPTAAQREKERKLVGEYNKATRQFLVAKAAKSYMQNPYGFKPQRMSGAVKAAKKPTAPKRTRSARPTGTVAKPRGMKPGALAARRGVKVSAEQRAIATAFKKQINSRNIRATRAMLRAVAKDQGYTGKDAIRRLTQTLDRGYSGGPLGGMAKPLPLNRQRGNAYSARKSRELGLNRRFSDALWIASPTTKRTSAAYVLADETLSGRHTRSALKAAAQQSRRRAGKPRRRSKP